MKKCLHIYYTTLIVFMFSINVSAAIYYVSTSGLNTNNGQSTTTPWQTLAYAVSQAHNGDVILLNRGDIFRESVSIPNGVSLKDYGTAAALPILSGAIPDHQLDTLVKQ